MPLSDLVYGPKRDARGIRPTLVDMDTVREVVHKAEALVNELEMPDRPPAVVTYVKRAHPSLGGGDSVKAGELDDLSIQDRQTLQVFVQRGPAQAGVSMLAGSWGAITAHSFTDPTFGERARRELEEIFLDNGEPIFRPRMFAYLLPLLGAAVAVAMWVWLLLVTALPLPAVIIGWGVSVGVALVAVRRSAALVAEARTSQARHRIRSETRAKTIARRTDAHMNLKVGALVAALALPTGFALAVLTNAFGLKG